MDNVSKAKRSWIMSRIRSSGTKPEKALEGILRRDHRYFLTHDKSLPGRPDVVMPISRTAIFVHGCFFHGCPIHYKRPKSNVDFWVSKVQANMRRDVRSVKALWRRGWHVIRVWEHSLGKNSLERTEKRLLKRIRANHSKADFTGLRPRRRCKTEARNHA